MLVRIPIDPGVDAIQSIVSQVFTETTFPNFPAYQKLENNQWVASEFADATHVVWDDWRLNQIDKHLIEEIAADPSKLPADKSDFTRDKALQLYPYTPEDGP